MIELYDGALDAPIVLSVPVHDNGIAGDVRRNAHSRCPRRTFAAQPTSKIARSSAGPGTLGGGRSTTAGCRSRIAARGSRNRYRATGRHLFVRCAAPATGSKKFFQDGNHFAGVGAFQPIDVHAWTIVIIAIESCDPGRDLVNGNR